MGDVTWPSRRPPFWRPRRSWPRTAGRVGLSHELEASAAVVATSPQRLASLVAELRDRRREDYPATVYFVRQGSAGPIKIGISEDAEKRVKELQVGNHEILNILATAPGNQITESFLHAVFAQDWIRGEWFSSSPKLLQFVKDVSS